MAVLTIDFNGGVGGGMRPEMEVGGGVLTFKLYHVV
jgi:hypothetical protein